MMTMRKLRRSTRECNNPFRSAMYDDKRELRRLTRECNNPFRSVNNGDEPSSVRLGEEDMTKKQSLEVQETETLGEKQEEEGTVASTTVSVSVDLDSPSTVLLKKVGKKTLNHKQQAKLIRKLAVLLKKFQLIKMHLCTIPFVPITKLDFDKHEELLRKLQLWDFVHVQFDTVVDLDLLGALIVNYKRSARSSSVNGYKVMVNRADLARAVKLPVNKVTQSEEIDVGVLSADSISFLEEFVRTWILLHEDKWIFPKEVLDWMKLIREGKPQKIDWAAMLWFMIEKELAKGEKLQTCFYASHLQYLMKSQHSDLFRKENGVERQVSADIKMKSVEEVQVNDMDNEEDTKLTLGQERSESEHQQVRDEENLINFDKGKATAHPSERPVDEDGEQKMNELLTLRPCSFNKPEPLGDVIDIDDDESDVDINEDEEEDELDVDEDEDEDEEDDEEDEDEEDGGHEYSQRYRELSRMSSDKFQSMEPDGMPSMQPLENSHIEDFFLSGPPQNNMSQMNVRGPSMYPRKRELSCKDDMQYHRPTEQNKRMRNDGQCNHGGSTMDMYMEQLTALQYNIKSLYDEKEAQAMDAERNQQILMGEMQSRDMMIENLKEEVQKRDKAIYNLKYELGLMADLVKSYRNALKDTQKAFAEYRQRHPEP